MIELKGVTKQYLYGARVLGALDMRVDDGEIIALLGGEQSGKTTLLKVVANVTDCEGEVLIDGAPPCRKSDDVIMVFDDLAVFKNRSFLYNLSYPLKIRGEDKAEIKRRAEAAAERMGITAWLGTKVKNAPLIYVKRLGVARLFLRDSRVILIDDITRGLTRAEAKELWDEVAPILLEKAKGGTSIIYAVTDCSEATSIADRIAVLHSGELKQLARIDEIYDNPSNIWAAQALNEHYHFERARLEDKDGKLHVVLGVETPASKADEYVITVEHLRGRIAEGYVGKTVYVGWNCFDFAQDGARNERADYALRDGDGYLIRTESGIWVRCSHRRSCVCTLPEAAKIRLYDFENENSLHLKTDAAGGI